MGYNFVAYNWVYVHSFSCCCLCLLASKSTKSREILREFELIAGQGHPRSSILVRIETRKSIRYPKINAFYMFRLPIEARSRINAGSRIQAGGQGKLYR